MQEIHSIGGLFWLQNVDISIDKMNIYNLKGDFQKKGVGLLYAWEESAVKMENIWIKDCTFSEEGLILIQ